VESSLTEAAELEAQIEMAIRDLRKSYRRTVKTVASLKEKINDLELRISRERHAQHHPQLEKLNSAVESLDIFVDSVIVESARAKENCERLKRKCEMQAFKPAQLENLQTLCQENEQLAKDLLCYSLGRLRRTQGTSRANYP